MSRVAALPRPSPHRRSKTSARWTTEVEPLTGGTIYKARTSAGTVVAVRPMPGFSKSYAMLSTRYGALDTHLPDGTVLPVGIAHFLEHKMFETPEGDVFDLYAKRGASANAFTTFDHTAYLFSCTSRFQENLDTLLETLHKIHAGEAGIAREKGIIGQEIAMYDDDPGWRSYFGLLEALYRKHPLHFGIAGTKETIAPINPDILRRTHAAYYHPANLGLFVAGDVSPAEVLLRAEALLKAVTPGQENRRTPTLGEPKAPAKAEVRIALSVSRPNVALGIKDAPPGVTGPALVRLETETEILLDVLYGDGGRVEAPLYREGILDGSLGAAYQADHDYAFVSISADVDAEEPFRSRLLEETEAVARQGFTREDVERARRRALGGYLRTFNSPERVAATLLGLHLKGSTLADGLAALDAVTPRKLSERLESLLAAGRTWCVVHPRRRR